MEPLGTPAVTFVYVVTLPLRATPCLLSLKRSRKRLCKFTDILFWISLKTITIVPHFVKCFRGAHENTPHDLAKNIYEPHTWCTRDN